MGRPLPSAWALRGCKMAHGQGWRRRGGERGLGSVGAGNWGVGFILWCCPCAPARPSAQWCNLCRNCVNRCGPVPGCRASSECACLWGMADPGEGER